MSRSRVDCDRYKPTKRLTLTEYQPAAPHGTTKYDWNPPPGPELRDFDPDLEVPEHEQVQLEIVEIISGGTNSRAQVLKCKIIKSRAWKNYHDHAQIPSQESIVVAKVFDHKLWPSDYGAPIKNIELNDGALCRESCAYKHLFRREMTGYPHTIAQYYGTWAVKFVVRNVEGETCYRTVGLILMEYIDGYSIEDLCDRDEYDVLIPDDKQPIIFYQSDGDHQVTLDINHDVRMEVLRQVLDGAVRHMHIGLMCGAIEPENILITMRHGTEDLKRPRVVELGLSLAQLWSKTRSGKRPGHSVHCHELTPFPPHPMERFSTIALTSLVGWFPQEWADEGMKSQAGARSDNQFKAWLIHTFGPLEGNPRYSSFKTMRRLIEKKNNIVAALEKGPVLVQERDCPRVLRKGADFIPTARLEYMTVMGAREAWASSDSPDEFEDEDIWNKGGSVGEEFGLQMDLDQPVLGELDETAAKQLKPNNENSKVKKRKNSKRKGKRG
ncbi:hypothetical protein CSIM01_05557 [Colletotrichum simmondsii]|uniref:Protein kinase domain-containing protein n=1 Tax=Colletotrichum simmondsii TaxID=703756 RepID=A0A135S1K3_9PEZI|nr:hypothetical protein CSIM01_05557 [Colletotrichum simmondsii]